MQRILSISGLRGVVGDGLDPAYVAKFAAAYGTMMQGGSVIVARDGRSSGPMIKQAVLAGLLATGCKVLDAGIIATPTCGVLVTHHPATGALLITASHNPIAWNGLKPFRADGSVFDESAGKQLLSILESDAEQFVPTEALGGIISLEEPSAPHRELVLKLIDGDAIRDKKFKVVLDCNHGAGSILGPRLLEGLGCELVSLGATPDGRFEHPPEPLEQNLTSLCEAVRREAADVGFAQDPDADRLAIVDGNGRYIGEELTLALCADWVLSQRPGPVVVNGSTSRTTADIAAKYNCEFHRSYVGEAHVVAKMKAVSAVIGGEGNGGVIEPKVGYVRDSFVSMAYVLAGLAAKDQPLAEWVDSLPRYTIVKEKITCPREKVAEAARALREAYSTASVEEGDGLRLDWPDRWVQVRASNTEPILRIIAEAPDETTAHNLCAEARQIVQQSVS